MKGHPLHRSKNKGMKDHVCSTSRLFSTPHSERTIERRMLCDPPANQPTNQMTWGCLELATSYKTQKIILATVETTEWPLFWQKKKKKASLQASGFTPLILGRPQTRGKTNLEGGKDTRLGFGRSRVKGHLRPTAVNILPRLFRGKLKLAGQENGERSH